MTLSTLLFIPMQLLFQHTVASDSSACSSVFETPVRKGSLVILDGEVNEKEWKDAGKLSNFSFPWADHEAPSTVFFAKIEDDDLCFAFRVTDRDVVVSSGSNEEGVAKGDRVELFFAKDRRLDEYYCVEIGPEGAVLDYKASFYRKFDYSWNFTGLGVKARKLDGGYQVEGRIPLTTLRDLGVLSLSDPGACALVGLYRAEFSSSDEPETKQEWISWILPKTAEPDFHVNSSFGCFRLSPAK